MTKAQRIQSQKELNQIPVRVSKKKKGLRGQDRSQEAPGHRIVGFCKFPSEK